MDLEDLLNVTYSMWVDDYGAMAERQKVRDAIDQSLAQASALVAVETVNFDASASYDQAQLDLMALQPPARPRKKRKSKSDNATEGEIEEQ